MGNVIYGKNLPCFDTIQSCAEKCGKAECVFVDKCNGNSSLNYVCLPIDMRILTLILFASCLLVVGICSCIVACYACRAIKASFRNAVGTDGDIVFYNARNVVNMPHPAVDEFGHYKAPTRERDSQRDWNLRHNGYIR
uniref:Uncharacterized protein n=1 Tax=Panagrellus redivivus TaxID=6233 RepID=A0A7E4ZXB2_PANRE